MDKNEISLDCKKAICNNIDMWLKTKNEDTIRSFTERLGVSRQSVQRWRKHICIPDIQLIPKICEITNMSLDELFGISSNSDNERTLIDKYRKDEKFRNIIDSMLDYFT